ncbi:ArpU family phage packaging/lysis transcriptional regulator [Cytobacillus sp. IB215316]|uniref:ArpU family phage packaging/lysis transcriptional regulator n=1 Tax=Cytobacillus sp. IB215316 TaxID=3097354 RepID=UPI002A0DAAB5|nr:ArpU family phage packaging/lysis transcriptional regulator [Cytobacillus sp. IB215316]MDX8359812.1 ArpU family phage packaging/lysis transcriptional regulator [Cytobacillus sp. IB215316]
MTKSNNKENKKRQLTFVLPKIDAGATKERVEGAFEQYRIYLLSVPEQFEPKVTQSFSFVPSSPTNEFRSFTEDAAISKVDYEIEQERYIQKVQRAVNRLSYQERAIIIKRYMNEEDVCDYEIYNDIGMSERSYYRIKKRAFYKLALALRVEVYEQEEGDTE